MQANLFSRVARLVQSYTTNLGELLEGPRRRSFSLGQTRRATGSPTSATRASFAAGCAVSSAEDPEKLLDQVVNEMQEDLIKMRQAAAQVRRVGRS